MLSGAASKARPSWVILSRHNVLSECTSCSSGMGGRSCQAVGISSGSSLSTMAFSMP